LLLDGTIKSPDEVAHVNHKPGFERLSAYNLKACCLLQVYVCT